MIRVITTEGTWKDKKTKTKTTTLGANQRFSNFSETVDFSIRKIWETTGWLFRLVRPKTTKCEPLKEFSELILPKTTKNEKKFKYQNWSFYTVGTVQIL